MAFFPMFVDISNKNVLVVGGGKVAFQKVRVLSDFDASITVLAPTVISQIEELSVTKDITIIKEAFREEFVDNGTYEFVVAATDDMEINSLVNRLCVARKIPVNVVDKPSLCTFFFPSIYKNKNLVCGVSSGGANPVMTQYVRNLLAESLPENIGDINDRMSIIREDLKKTEPDMKKRKYILQTLLTELLESEM